MSKLDKLLNKVDTYCKGNNFIAPFVSSKDVHWQLDHIYRAIVAISKGHEITDPKNYIGKVSASGKILLAIGRFPRGKGKAPKESISHSDISKESIERIKKRAYDAIEHIRSLEKNSYFDHPLFGQLNKRKTLRLLYVHTKHHLKIIEDIRSKGTKVTQS